MPDTMTGTDEDGGRVGRADVLGVERRRRCTPEGKVRIFEETYLPGHSVSLVARRHGIAGNQLFTWRRLMAQGALTAAGAGEKVVPTSQYWALETQIRELQRLLGKKTMENEVLREAVTRAAGPKNCCCARARGRRTHCERRCRCDWCLATSPLRDHSCRTTSPAGTTAAARRRSCRSDPDAGRRSADLRLPMGSCAAAPAGRSHRGRRAQPQAHLPGDEAARFAPPAPGQTKRAAPA